LTGTLWRVEKRMDHALGIITDILEAVLAHDSAYGALGAGAGGG
jgi:hypothetical protein